MQTEIESKISFENIIRNRISHFQNIYHANEAGRLTLALRAIEELIPPSHFESSPPVEQTVDAGFKEITGFNSHEEMAAYEKGRGHEESVILDFIKTWDGSTNSGVGNMLNKKFIELYNQRTPDAGQLEKIIGDAFDKGVDNGCYQFIIMNNLEKRFAWMGEQPPTKDQYIKQAIEQFNNLKQ